LPSHWRYQFLSRLGSGGTAEVYLGADRLTGQQVALKVTTGPNIIRLRSEYSRLCRLGHQGLVRAYDLHQDDVRAVMAMELIDSPNLETLAGGPFDRQRLLSIWAQLAGVLKHFHQHGQVHGDIKPGNVMLLGDRAVLIDLGLAGAWSKKGSSDAIGTPAYAAPENLAGEPASPASDVYSLGLVIWGLAGGQLPSAELRVDPGGSWAGTKPPLLPDDAWEMLATMLRHEPLERFRSAVYLVWAMDESRLFPSQDIHIQLPLAGRSGKLRQAMAWCREGKTKTIRIDGAPGRGRTRFLQELKVLLQLDRQQACLLEAGELERLRSSGSPASLFPHGCWLLVDGLCEPPPWLEDAVDRGRLGCVLSGTEQTDATAGGDGLLLHLTLPDRATYKAMLSKLWSGADRTDLDRCARWLETQAGGNFNIAKAIIDGLLRKRLVRWDRYLWRFNWQDIFGSGNMPGGPQQLFGQAVEEDDSEAVLFYGRKMLDSGQAEGQERKKIAYQVAEAYRRLGRFKPGLEFWEGLKPDLGESLGYHEILIPFCQGAGQVDRALAAVRHALETAPPDEARTRSILRCYLGWMTGITSGRAVGEAVIDEVLTEANRTGEIEIQAKAHQFLSLLAYGNGDWAKAVRNAGLALQLLDTTAEPADLAGLHSILGYGQWQLGQTDQADRSLAECLGLYGRHMPAAELANLYGIRGLVCASQEQWDQAMECFCLASHFLGADAGGRQRAFIDANMAMALSAQNRHRQAREKYLDAYEQYLTSGDAANAAICLGNAGLKEKALGNGRTARRLLHRMLDMAAGTGLEYARMLGLKNMGLLELEDGSWLEALELFGKSLELGASKGCQPHFDNAAFGALAASRTGDLDKAKELLGLARTMARGKGQQATVNFVEGMMMASQGQTEPGSKQSLDAGEQLRKLGRARDAAVAFLLAGEQAVELGATTDLRRIQASLLVAEAEFRTIGDRAMMERARSAIVETARAMAVLGGMAAGLEMLEAFYQLAVLLESGSGPGQITKAALESAVRLSGSERGGLFLAGEDGRPVPACQLNLDQETAQDALEFSAAAIEQAARDGAEVVSNDAMLDEAFRSHRSVQQNSIRSLICIPIQFREGGPGALYLDSRLKAGIFSRERKDFLRALAALIGAVIESSRLMERLREGSEPGSAALGRMLGRSEPLMQMIARIRAAAPAEVNVLIEGETGTGKELAARAIHELSGRRGRTFLALDCGSLPESLLEAELFGYKKGAFTGAFSDKPGLFEAADGGTLFLDEISSASQAVQARLLRAIENREIRRVGDTAVRTVDVRLLCATNKDLEFEMADGRFKPDLFYRLNVFRLSIPPLRDRGSDILLLARRFLSTYTRKFKKKGLRFSDSAAKAMMRYPWPGNIRELENAVKKSVLLAKGRDITEKEMELPTAEDERPAKQARERAPVKRSELVNAMRENGNDTAKAALKLGITRRQVQRLLMKFKIAT